MPSGGAIASQAASTAGTIRSTSISSDSGYLIIVMGLPISSADSRPRRRAVFFRVSR